jgi:hypothetical protein
MAKVGRKTGKKSKSGVPRKAATAKKAKKKAARVSAKTSAAVHPLHSLLVKEVSSHVFQSLSGGKIAAINACVNAEMNKITNTWNDAGHMDTDYHQNKNSMLAFLSDVRACLQPNYNFIMNDPALVTACVSATVYQVKLLIFGRTT